MVQLKGFGLSFQPATQVRMSFSRAWDGGVVASADELVGDVAQLRVPALTIADLEPVETDSLMYRYE